MLGRHFTNSCFHILRILSIVPSGSLVTEFDLWSLLQALDADTLLYIYPVCDKRRYSAFSEAISHFSPPLLQCKLLVALWFLRSIPAPWATSHFPPVWMGWTNITDLKWSNQVQVLSGDSSEAYWLSSWRKGCLLLSDHTQPIWVDDGFS